MAKVKRISDMVVISTVTIGERLGIRPDSVRKYLRESLPGGRYAHLPFPAPDGKIGNYMFWDEERIPEIDAWNAARKTVRR